MKLKSKLSFALVTTMALFLTGCNLIPAKQENQTTGDNSQPKTMMEEPLSDKTDLNTVEKELNDTQLKEFDSELNGLDQEINNL